MGQSEHAINRRKRPPKPLDQAQLEELALAYVARFATSAAKLNAYLARKLRERGWDDENEPDPASIVRRHVEHGHVDDEAFARARSGSLMRRGYGPRRIERDLGAAGIAEDIRQGLRASEAEQRRAALALARRRRFGPYATQVVERAQREKQLAAMLRAGHAMDHACRILDAVDPDAAEAWVMEAEEEEF